MKKGPYGMYIEITSPDAKKPKRVSIPKNIDASTVDITLAKKLEELPRIIGKHPDGGDVKAGIGPYGPYIFHEKTYVSIKSVQDVFEILLEDAITKIAEKLASPKKARFTRKTTVKKESAKKVAPKKTK